MAQPAVDYAYRYGAASHLEADADGSRRLGLSTWDGPGTNPRLFRGAVHHPVLFADALLAVGATARARFHVPPALLASILRVADPVVTAGDGRLRFEAFSACASAYARLDLLPGFVDGAYLGAGTTNVDLGPGIRAALAGVTATARLDLEVGAGEVAVEVDGARAVERRVSLPERWVRGFAEAQAVQASMTPRLAAGGPAFRRFLRALPRSAKHPLYLTGRGGELAISHRPADGAVPLQLAERLRLVERLAGAATAVAVHATEGGASAWVLTLPDARFTLALSTEAWRGFSGEGQVVESLARPVPARVQARVAAALRWHDAVRAADLAEELGILIADVEAAMARLAAAGQVGFDLGEGTYFPRALPFARAGGVEAAQPRLRRARAMVESGAVRLEAGGRDEDGVVAWVAGRSAEYRVRIGPDGRACTCAWWGRHPGDRGPCAHLVAVQLALAGPPG